MPLRRRFAPLPLLLLALLLPAGCQVLGIAANAMPRAPVPPKVVLAGNTVGIMVWADRGLVMEWSTIRQDLGNSIQFNLQQAIDAKAKETVGVSFPYPAESFVRWQRDHREAEFQPVTAIAPRLHVSRLIYVEVQHLSTRSSTAMALYRGTATASLKVVEVAPGATVGKIIYEEGDIRVVYPRHSTDDGRPEGNDQQMYAGSITFLAEAIATRFIEHPAED